MQNLTHLQTVIRLEEYAVHGQVTTKPTRYQTFDSVGGNPVNNTFIRSFSGLHGANLFFLLLIPISL